MGNNIDFSFTFSTRTVTESRALVERLVDMYPDDFSQENSIEVSLDEENVHLLVIIAVLLLYAVKMDQ